MIFLNRLLPFLALLYLFTTHLTSEELQHPPTEDESGISLVDAINTAVPRVHDTVSLLSGAWIESGAPLSDKSAVDAYQLGYGYASSSIDRGALADGWEFFHPSKVRIIQPNLPKRRATGLGNHQYNKRTRIYLISKDGGGASVLFIGDRHGHNFRPQLSKTGYTHISSIASPLRTDPKTTHVKWDRKKKKVVMTFRDGTKRIYKQYRVHSSTQTCFKRSFHIVKMTLPSGNRRHFRYKKDELKLIETKTPSNDVIGRVTFKEKGKHRLIVTMSDGRQVSFYYKKISDKRQGRVVTAVQPEGGKKYLFSYSGKSKKHVRRIYKKERSDGKRVEASFYRKKKSGSSIPKMIQELRFRQGSALTF